jgi:hypothetical protein
VSAHLLLHLLSIHGLWLLELHLVISVHFGGGMSLSGWNGSIFVRK